MSTDQASTTSPLTERLKDPTFSAYFLLRVLFTVAPILFGLDKFFNLLTHPHHWSMYLASWINDIVPGTADQCMYVVGVIEIAAGVLVAVIARRARRRRLRTTARPVAACAAPTWRSRR